MKLSLLHLRKHLSICSTLKYVTIQKQWLGMCFVSVTKRPVEGEAVLQTGLKVKYWILVQLS